MYYLLSIFGFLPWIILIIGFVYLNRKINALSQRIDAQKGSASMHKADEDLVSRAWGAVPQDAAQIPAMQRAIVPPAVSDVSTEEVGGRWLGNMAGSAVKDVSPVRRASRRVLVTRARSSPE